ncbi:unnamed protein product [Brachionus calyciflorus]|uniref:Serine hydrolase domain-containing protein n=1 Tax=Brachionus calyciflorus TaxID=104777 RepID=A0A813VD19_9BILA|nr:unnamed protein product [Brachionus calyciflorus]
MATKILKFWFGENLDSLNQPNYKHKPELWFKLKYETDQIIKHEFSEWLSKAENDQLNDWLQNPREKLAIIILLDQFSRNIYRGTSDMFKNDEKCLKIASDMIENNELESLSLIEKFFVYLPLLHYEDLATAKKSLDLIESLVKISPTQQKTQFSKYYYSSKTHVEILEKYGRYPHRNFLLNRQITEEESKFLITAKHNFMRSVKPTTPSEIKIKKPLSQEVKNLPLQKILFLHGFRQNSNKIKKRIGFILQTLKQECNTHCNFLNGTHPYKPVGEIADQIDSTLGDDYLNPIESQRVWFISNDSNDTYDGLDESLENIKIYARANGPYDGIVGFGQGAVLTSIFVKLNPKVFNYIINISAFEPRDDKYKNLFSPERPFEFPSLHIYGHNDGLITKNRSEQFAKCFKNPILAEHPDGHFAPLSWSIDKLTTFIRNQSNLLKPIVFFAHDDLANKIQKINENLERFKLDDLNLQTIFVNKNPLDFLQSNNFKNLELSNFDYESYNSDDCLILIYLCLKKAEHLEHDKEETPITRAILSIFLDFYQKNNLSQKILSIIFENNWRDLVMICDLSYSRPESLDLYNFLIEKFFNQILLDLKFIDFKNKSFLIQQLTSIHNIELNPLDLSNLAKYLPRIKSSVDKRTRIGREIAIRLNPITEPALKIKCYNHYRKCLSNICHFLDYRDKNYESKNPRQFFILAKHDKKTMQSLLNTPLSDAILNPVPEPVDVSSHEKMRPLYEWLSQNKQNKLTMEDLKFLKGTVTTDGRLDLCKQVIGPSGIKPLLDSMENNKNIDRLLLGNNIIGDDGGFLIGEFIKSGKSPLTVWYIAGNNLTHKGIKPICDALVNDSQVTALWLKRNPLKSDGMIHIGNLMRVNSNIQTLDLLNCGLLDKGVEILMENLKENKTLKHLYLSANGITPIGLESVRKYWSGCLETLFLGANRVGDDGAKIIADILKNDTTLQRLNLSSCRIGSQGMKYLCESLKDNRSLLNLDIGYMKASMDLGELGNFIENEGADYLSELIETNQSLMCLNITHNHITQIGMKRIVEAVKKNESLINLEYVQYGVSLNEITLTQLRYSLALNKKKLSEKQPNFDPEEVIIPKHVKEIYSVYRTH